MTRFPPAPRRRILQAAVVTPLAVVGLTATAGSASASTPAHRGTGGSPSLEARNTDVVTRALAEFYGAGRTEKFSSYFSADHVEHDPAIAAGRAGLVAHVKETRAQSPRVVATPKRFLAQGSFVAVHSHRSATPGNEFTGTSVIELFDLRDGRIVEHWAWTQAVPATSRSGSSMFSDVYRYPGAVPTVTPEREEANKQLIVRAWAAIYSVRDFTVLDRYWATGDGYLQHNPNVPNGVGGLKGFLGTQPPSISQNRFALADRDLVLTVNQSLATSGDLDDDRVGSAVVDIYRVVGSRVVEHWDVVGPVPTTSANGNSVFSRLYPAS